jgi:hypothetical protein
MITAKIDTVRALLAAGDNRKALSIAARWPRLGPEAGAIRAAHEAYERPVFQRQIGRDPDALIHTGVAALARWCAP